MKAVLPTILACPSSLVCSVKVLDMESIDLSGGDLGPAGLAVSPDGKFPYVAAESPATVPIFRRNP